MRKTCSKKIKDDGGTQDNQQQQCSTLIYTSHMRYTKTHMTGHSVHGRAEQEIKKWKNNCDIRHETAEKCSFISRPQSRNEAEKLPEAAANITVYGKQTCLMEKRNLCQNSEQNSEHPLPWFVEDNIQFTHRQLCFIDKILLKICTNL